MVAICEADQPGRLKKSALMNQPSNKAVEQTTLSSLLLMAGRRFRVIEIFMGYWPAT